MTDTTNPVVAALPGAGWLAMFREYDGLEHGDVIVGWLVYADGNVRPFTVDQSGTQADPTTLTDFARLQEPRR